MKEFKKSANISQSYERIASGTFCYGPRCSVYRLVSETVVSVDEPATACLGYYTARSSVNNRINDCASGKPGTDWNIVNNSRRSVAKHTLLQLQVSKLIGYWESVKFFVVRFKPQQPQRLPGNIVELRRQRSNSVESPFINILIVNGGVKLLAKKCGAPLPITLSDLQGSWTFLNIVDRKTQHLLPTF